MKHTSVTVVKNDEEQKQDTGGGWFSTATNAFNTVSNNVMGAINTGASPKNNDETAKKRS